MKWLDIIRSEAGYIIFTISIVAIAAVLTWPDKFDRATVLKVCPGGVLILELDGAAWIKRHRIVGDWRNVCPG